MGNTITPTARQFGRWLRQNRSRWDGIGILAVQSARDPDWPRDGRLADLHRHLIEIGAGVGAQRALTAAWAEFLQAMRQRSDAAPFAGAAERGALPLGDYLGSTGDNAWDNGAYQDLLCPVCYGDYVHFGEASGLDGAAAYQSGWDGHGALLVIPLWCESEHAWELCVGSHKGQSSVFVRNPRPFTDADRRAFHGDGLESAS